MPEEINTRYYFIANIPTLNVLPVGLLYLEYFRKVSKQIRRKLADDVESDQKENQ